MFRLWKLLALAAVLVVFSACSDSSNEEYFDVYQEINAEQASISRSLGSAPQIDIYDSTERTEIRSHLQKLREARASIDALLFRWQAVEPGEDFRVHHGLMDQGLSKRRAALDYSAQAYEQMEAQVGNLFADTGRINDLIREAQTASADSSAFYSAANRESDRLNR